MTIEPIVLWCSVGFAFLWVALFVAIGIRAKRGMTTIEHFLIYGKDMNRNELRWTFYATNISLASIFIAIAVATAQSGLCAIWLIVAWVCGMWGFLWFYRSKTVQRFFVEKRGRTMFQFLEDIYGSSFVRKTGAIIAIIIFVGSVGAEFYAFVEVLRYLVLPDILVLPMCIFLTVLTVLYASIGGFRGVVKTELWQFIATIIGSIALAIILIFSIRQSLTEGDFVIPQFSDPAIWTGPYGVFSSPDFIIGAFIVFLTFMLSSMDAWQRCAAISEHKDAVEWTTGIIKQGSLVFPLIYGLPIVCGMLFLLIPAVDQDVSDVAALLQPVVVAISNCPIFWKIILFGSIFSGIVAAMISTADTLLVSAVYALFYDIFGFAKDAFDKTDEDLDSPKSLKQDAMLIRRARIWLLIFGLLSVAITVIGSYQVGLSSIIWALFSSLIIFSIPIIIGVVSPKFSSGKWISASASIIGGFASVIVLMIMAYLKGEKALAEAGPLAPVVGVVFAVICFLCTIPFCSIKTRFGN